MLTWNLRYFMVFLLSFVFSMLFTYISIKLFPKINLLDYPSDVKKHKKPTPVSGGIGIYFSYAVSLFLMFYYTNPLKIIVIGGLIVLFLGLLDDILGISAVIKLASLIILSIILSKFGIIIRMFPWYWANLLLTYIWVILITSAFNAIDNMDGLACGTAIIASFFFFLSAFFTDQIWFGLVSLALLGALIGFYFFNGFNAKIFLGDSGSFFIGFTLAAISIMGEWSCYKFKAIIIPVLILFYPIFDLFFVILIRIFEGTTNSIKESILYCGCDHSSHCISAKGFSSNITVLIIYIFSIIFSASALFLRNLNYFNTILLIIFNLFVCLIMFLFVLAGRKQLKSSQD